MWGNGGAVAAGAVRAAGSDTLLNLNVDKGCAWIFRCVKAKTRRLAGGKSRGFNADAAEKTPQDCLYLG